MSPDKTPRVALIQFPGSNCEWETKRAAEATGIDCDVFRWNLDPEALSAYDGYIVGGGFSYQDRVRSGVVATKEPIVARMMEEIAKAGKPALGICNGAQVLVVTWRWRLHRTAPMPPTASPGSAAAGSI